MPMQEHLQKQEDTKKISLNEILRLENLDNVKVRFVVPNSKYDPLDFFKTGFFQKW